jgi:hypothetical protein
MQGYAMDALWDEFKESLEKLPHTPCSICDGVNVMSCACAKSAFKIILSDGDTQEGEMQNMQEWIRNRKKTTMIITFNGTRYLVDRGNGLYSFLSHIIADGDLTEIKEDSVLEKALDEISQMGGEKRKE